MPYKDPNKKREQARKYAAEHRDELSRNRKRHYRKNREEVLAKCREYYHTNKTKIAVRSRKAHLKRMFNISPERFQDLVNKQDGKCAICQKNLIKRAHSYKDFQIDHDHNCCPFKRSCGSCIRGILCSTCNLTIGGVYDDPTLLRRAADYLEHYNNHKGSDTCSKDS